jgi:hypothetical protein
MFGTCCIVSIIYVVFGISTKAGPNFLVSFQEGNSDLNPIDLLAVMRLIVFLINFVLLFLDMRLTMISQGERIQVGLQFLDEGRNEGKFPIKILYKVVISPNI